MKRRIHKSRRGIKRKSKVVTYENATSLKPNQYASSDEHEGIAFELYEAIEDQQITIKELVEKFYRIILPEKGIKRSEVVKPVLFKLMEDAYSSLPEKYWFCIFRGNFFINIYAHDGKHGPHTAQLWFKSFTTKKAFWIATLQIVAFFFNEEQMLTELLKCIEQKEWFYPESDANRSIIP